jgi:hypothetical protein
LEIWRGVALVGLLGLVAAFFMPWITVGASSFLASVNFSYSMGDLYARLITKSPLIQAIQPTFGTTYSTKTGTRNLPIDAAIQSDAVFATSLAVVFYSMSVIVAFVFLTGGSALYSLPSAFFATGSFVSTFLAAGFIRQQVDEWGQLGSNWTGLFNQRLDVGAWLALVAGFMFVGSYLLSGQTEVEPKVLPSLMFCRECGRKIPRDSKFCKECGARLTQSI